jgi:hypothetical protein
MCLLVAYSVIKLSTTCMKRMAPGQCVSNVAALLLFVLQQQRPLAAAKQAAAFLSMRITAYRSGFRRLRGYTVLDHRKSGTHTCCPAAGGRQHNLLCVLCRTW